MYILKYKEWLLLSREEARWVYDVCDELPVWSDTKKDYVFKKEPKRIDPREAKKLIKEHSLKCIHETEEGEKIYAKYESEN